MRNKKTTKPTNDKPNPKDYKGRPIEYWHARKNWLQSQKDNKPINYKE